MKIGRRATGLRLLVGGSGRCSRSSKLITYNPVLRGVRQTLQVFQHFRAEIEKSVLQIIHIVVFFQYRCINRPQMEKSSRLFYFFFRIFLIFLLSFAFRLSPFALSAQSLDWIDQDASLRAKSLKSLQIGRTLGSNDGRTHGSSPTI